MTLDKSASNYWKANLRIIFICMGIWALVSYGFGIILRPLLAGIRIGGTDLGFWFAQQGPTLPFTALIVFYNWYLNRLAREYDVDEH